MQIKIVEKRILFNKQFSHLSKAGSKSIGPPPENKNIKKEVFSVPTWMLCQNRR
jgi:hypothetical protein